MMLAPTNCQVCTHMQTATAEQPSIPSLPPSNHSLHCPHLEPVLGEKLGNEGGTVKTTKREGREEV